jgi:hypothetical protein
MTNPGFPPGFHRDVDAIMRAFNVGLQFDPPLVMPNELRANLRVAGMYLGSDDIQMPGFELPEPDDELPPEPPEEND